MKIFQLCNFDPGVFPNSFESSIGPFAIKLASDYLQKRKSLENLSPSSFSLTITGNAGCEKDVKGLLGSREVPEVWDLCLICSFLSGRRTFTPDEFSRFVGNSSGYRIVEHDFFKAANTAWENRGNFSKEKEIKPLFIHLANNNSSEAEVKLLLGCLALEIVSSQYSGNSTAPSDPKIEKLIHEISEVISKSEIEKDLKNKFKGVIGHWGFGGAIDSFRQFLISSGIIDERNDDSVEQKIVGVNRIRNGIVHSGEIRPPSWVSGEERIHLEKVFVLSYVAYRIN